MRPWPTVSAVAITIGLILFTIVGCFLGLITGAPSEPCPGENGSGDGMIRAGLFFISLFVVLTAFASIVLAWWGMAARRENPKPVLIVSATGLATCAVLSTLILVVMQLTQKC